MEEFLGTSGRFPYFERRETSETNKPSIQQFKFLQNDSDQIPKTVWMKFSFFLTRLLKKEETPTYCKIRGC